MINKSSSFFSGFFVGALASGATALLFALRSGRQSRAQTRQGTGKSSSKADRAFARYTEELGNWSGKGAVPADVSAPPLADAPMGWY